MFLQGYYGVNADKDTDGIKSNTASVKENTSAKQANKVANQTNGITLATETASELKNTTQVNANTIAKDRNTVATSRMSTASKAASATLALFGGGFGLVLTAITLILPELLSYISELGEEKNAHKELIETLDEENAKREQEYNNKMRAIDTAEKLSEQYRKMTEDSKKMAEGSEEQIKIQKDLSNTYDIIKDVIEGLGDKNNKYTISTDENGKIIVKVNGNIIDSFDDLKSATTELTKQKLEADKAQLESSRHSTKTMLENIKARIEGYKKEVEALGILDKVEWSVSKKIWERRSAVAKDNAEREKERLDKYGANWSPAQQEWSKNYIANQEAYAQEADDEVINEQGKLGDVSGLEAKKNEIEKILADIDSSINEKNIQIAEYEESINKNRYDTGGADSNRGDKIAEPPQSNEDKKKSKAEKEAEKLAKQQADYDKVLERVAIVADETSRINNLKSTISSGLIQSGALISSGNSNIDKAIADASIRYGVDENWIHALVQKESSYNVRTGEGTPYKGLTQVSNDKMIAGEDIWDIYDNINAGVRHFKKMLDLANGDYFEAYVKYNEGENGSRSNEAVRNATAFNKLHDDIINGTSSFGNKLELASTTNLSEATQWADQMVEDGKYYGANGCTAFVKAFLGQMNSSFADTMDMYVPDLYNNVKDTDKFLNKKSGFNAGDIVITDSDGVFDEPDHVVIADGQGGYYGNSTSQEKVVHGSLSDFKYIWGGINTGTNKGAYSTGFNDAQFVKNLFSAYGIDDEKMYNLRNVKDISMMLKMTDAMGMNVKYSQKNPIAGEGK